MYDVAWLLGWLVGLSSIYRYDRLLVGGRMDAPSLGARLTPTGASSACWSHQSYNTLAPCTTYRLLLKYLYLYKYLFISKYDPDWCLLCWLLKPPELQCATYTNQNNQQTKIKIESQTKTKSQLCPLKPPECAPCIAPKLSAKIEIIKKRDSCKMWPISASAQLLRAAGSRAPFCILKQSTLKEMEHWTIQASSLNRVKKEAISKIFFSQCCHQAYIKWDQYRREWTSGWTSADTCVWYTQVENCLKCKRFIVWTLHSPNPKPQLSQILPKLLTSIVGGCPCHCSEQYLMQIRIQVFYWEIEPLYRIQH